MPMLVRDLFYKSLNGLCSFLLAGLITQLSTMYTQATPEVLFLIRQMLRRIRVSNPHLLE